MESRAIEELDLIGGDPAVDFVNTLGGLRDGPWDDEWLVDYRHLAAWSHRAGVLPRAVADRLLERAARDRGGAGRAHADAVVLREAMYRVFAARADHVPAPADDLDIVAGAYREALANARLVATRDGLDWEWDTEDLHAPVWRIAHAAVDLLRSPRAARLSQCGNCRWLFLDASKNRSRRWCSMAHCGSDAKVRRARARRHAG